MYMHIYIYICTCVCVCVCLLSCGLWCRMYRWLMEQVCRSQGLTLLPCPDCDRPSADEYEL